MLLLVHFLWLQERSESDREVRDDEDIFFAARRDDERVGGGGAPTDVLMEQCSRAFFSKASNWEQVMLISSPSSGEFTVQVLSMGIRGKDGESSNV